jgi:predicted Zn-dependent protease
VRARGPGAPSSIAERVLELVRSAEPSAEAEVTVRDGTAALTRFANSAIHQNVGEEVSRIDLRVAVDGRSASAGLDARPDRDGLGRLVEGALEAARVRPQDPDWPGLTPPEPIPDVDHWDEATSAASPDDRAARVRDFVSAGDGLSTAGACETIALEVAFANTAGQRLTGRATTAELSGIARTMTSDGSARHASTRLGDIDGRLVGMRAVAKATSAADPTDLEPGRYEVVLEPQCVADVLQFLVTHGFNGRAVEEGRSFLRLGERQLDASITLRDDATDPDVVGVPFDAEGTPRRRTTVVDSGVTRAMLHTRRTAAKAGAASTGNAVPGPDRWGALLVDLVMAVGDRTIEQLIGAMRRGLLVTDLWYTRILDPRTQVVTGLTRNGVWLVEDGAVVRPVRNLRFTQSYLEALGPGNVLGVGSERSLILDRSEGAYLVPALHLASWNFTGGARG